MKVELVDFNMVRAFMDTLDILIPDFYIPSTTRHPLVCQVLFGGDVGGLELSLSFRDGWAEMELRSEINVLEQLWLRFHESFKISVFLEYKSGVDGPFSELHKFEGMRISPPEFACIGRAFMNGAFSLHRVKIVADIDIDIATETGTEVNNSNSKHPVLNPVKDSSRPPFSRKIFEEDVLSDVTIIAKNGAEIKSHACFLSACSPVLTAMFKAWTEESQTRRVDMTDISEDAVRAFLHFVYFEDLEEPKKRIDVSFEVFKMGEKYNVPSLKNEMTEILLASGNISVELAFQMYMFTRNVDTAAELKTKARQILKDNFEELKALQEFREVFIKTPDVGIEIFADFMK